ncbi:hypothetical protein BD410DRAFT_846521 [Rickenella mellea]|uniref:Uncharacterized protein n=1 Tax=Rickenella mellea TaxID=50990 RepID=A0A4Y7PFU0_9AGAM|nr:hypothetical protein BD410DRAFT_846521 [Rickenella mellea]
MSLRKHPLTHALTPQSRIHPESTPSGLDTIHAPLSDTSLTPAPNGVNAETMPTYQDVSEPGSIPSGLETVHAPLSDTSLTLALNGVNAESMSTYQDVSEPRSSASIPSMHHSVTRY